MAHSNTDLEITRLLTATREQIWKAWSDPKHLKEWWCPQPWVTEVRAFEFRPGGSFYTYMHGPDGKGGEGTSDNPGIFLEIVPKERIVSTSMLTAGWRPANSWLPMTAIITLADEGKGTRYTARCLHLNAADCKKHEDMGFHEGWGICIGQLDAYAQKLSI